MKKTKIIGMITVLTAALVMTASARGFGMPGPRGGGMKHMKGLTHNAELAEQIGLTDEQAAKIEAVNYAAEKKRVQLKADVEVAEIEMKHLMQAGASDRLAILQASDKLGEARQALHKAELVQMLDVKDVLTAEQVKQLEKAMCDRRGKRGKRGHADAEGRRGRGDRKGRGGEFGKGRGGCMQDGTGPRACGKGKPCPPLGAGFPDEPPVEEPTE